MQRAMPPRAHRAAGLFTTLIAVLCLFPGACTKTKSSASSSPSANGAAGVKTATAGTSAADMAAADSLEAAFVSVAARVDPSVVLVQTTGGLGSGVVFDNQGDVVTNNHVVASGTSPSVTTPDGRQAAATLLGSFVPDDLAVLRVKGVTLHPATFGDSSKLARGSIVMAIGNPLGLQTSVTQGIVSALGRTVVEPGGIPIPDAIQTSAAINPGNSGGALVNLKAQVVGIPTLAAQDPQIGGVAPGIGFAIPANTVKDIAQQIVQYGKVVNSHRAYLGITTGGLATGQGVLVISVQPGGPAAAAGLAAGDIITKVNGEPVSSSQDFVEKVASLKPGDTVSLTVMHANGSQGTVSVKLGQFPG